MSGGDHTRMPRAGQTKPAVMPRLPDRIAIGVLTRTFPPELVDRVLALVHYAIRTLMHQAAAAA